MQRDTQEAATRIMSEYQKAVREQQTKYEADATRHMLSAARDNHRDMQEAADSQAITIHGLTAALTECMSHLRATNEAEHEATARATAQAQELDDLRDQLRITRESHAIQITERVRLANVARAAENVMRAAEQDLRAAQAQRDTLRQEKITALQLRDNAQDSLRLSREENNEIVADYERATERAAHDSKMAAQDRQDALAQESLLRRELSELTTKYQRLFTEHTTRTGELQSAQKELADARRERDSLDVDVKSALRRIDTLITERNAARSGLADARDHYVNGAATHNLRESNLRTMIANRDEIIAAQATAIDTLTAERDAARKLADANYNQCVSAQVELADAYGSVKYWTLAIIESTDNPRTRDTAEQSHAQAVTRRDSILAARKAARA